MQQTWLRQEGSQDLVLFVLGWAATPNAILHIDLSGYDVLACYGYDRVDSLPAADFSHYRRIYLFAWSFGVWASEQICRELSIYRAVALNGTPYPMDARYGMRYRAMQRSMQFIISHGGENPLAALTAKENRGIPAGPYLEPSAEEKLAELERLASWSVDCPPPQLTWHKAYIADKDEIFPPAKMKAYWETVGLGTLFSSYHYPFADPQIVLDELH